MPCAIRPGWRAAAVVADFQGHIGLSECASALAAPTSGERSPLSPEMKLRISRLMISPFGITVYDGCRRKNQIHRTIRAPWANVGDLKIIGQTDGQARRTVTAR